MSNDFESNPAALLTQEFWDERYGASQQIWSGNPNQRLVEQVSDLTPGVALEVGCGEGADAIWLAARGWQVLAVDVSPVVLERAARQAATEGVEIAARVEWQQADITTWGPAPRQFDLITSHFIHTPTDVRTSLNRRLAAAVRPGGSLLIVGHHPMDMGTSMRRPNLPDFFFTAEEVAATLDPNEWEILVADAQPREAKDPDGNLMTIHDAVLHARRR